MNTKCKKFSDGFTLIEILVVVAIIAILAAIAVPSYGKYIARGKLTTAQTDVALLSLKFENRYQRVLSYPLNDQTNTAALKALISGWYPASPAADFTFTSVDATASTYTIKATGVSSGVKDCVVSIDESGTKSITSCADLANNGEWL